MSEIIQLLKDSGAIKFGDFILASGKNSNYYIDVKLAGLTDANKEQADKLTENKLMSSDFIIISQQRDKLAETLTEIRKAVGSVNLFSSEVEQHKQMDKALRDISEILEQAGIS